MLYPAIDPPYSTVFTEIIDGIAQRLGATQVLACALPVDKALPTLKACIEHQSANAVITLGRVALQTYESSGLTLPQVIGALDLSPQTRPAAIGVSLAVDPALLFSTLKRLAPQTQRVFVVFNPDRERWIIEQAQQAAPGFNLTLMRLEARDLRTSAHQFLQMLEGAQAGTDAIWLTVDSQLVDTQAILPVIIEQSWRQHLVVFSNNLEHANLGVLFAVFPDNQKLGWRLAELALQLDSHPDRRPGVEPLRAVKRALNLRVANHLNLSITQQVEKQFDLIFR
ncbi:MAG: hypothetical protein U1F76_23010 [Candidatus Competibacteraceae bacterium]